MNAVNKPQSLASIKFLTGPFAGKTFQIDNPVTTIGRDATNDIVVRDDQKVSRYHARLLWNNGSWSIEKLAPQNILTVNKQQVQQADISNNTTIILRRDTAFLFLVNAEAKDLSDETRHLIPPVPASQPLEASPSPAPVHTPRG